jgi:hypothetical protein
MLEVIIETGSDIVRRSEHILETARTLVFSGSLHDSEALALYQEADRLMEAMFAMRDAVGRLRNSLEQRPRIVRSFPRFTTVQ